MNLDDIDMKISEDRADVEASEVFPRMLLCLPDMNGIQRGFEDLTFWSNPNSPTNDEQRKGTAP